MRTAIIDIGTNAVRLEIYDLRQRNAPELLHQDRRVVRLGNYLYKSGQLPPESFPVLIAVFTEFRAAIEAHGALGHIHAVGTSALREAKNALEFCQVIKEQSGIEIHVISGQREAELIALGIFANEPELRGHLALIDVGGGSTEWSICVDNDVVWCGSVPLGAVRCQQLVLKQTPPAKEDVATLRALARSEFAEMREKLPPEGLEFAVGSSGTARALADMGFAELHDFRAKLEQFVHDIATMDRAQIAAIDGMNEQRADIILAGSLILLEGLYALQVQHMRISRFSLRRGILAEILDKK